MRGKLIVLDGIDGSGKATQTKRLKERLAAESIAVKTHSFPSYGTVGAVPVEKYLNWGLALQVPPEIASALYAADRRCKAFEIEEELAKGTTYLLDRYVSSNGGHQGGKFRSMNAWASEDELIAARKKFLDWLTDYEFNQLRLPVPDKSIFLDIHPLASQQLIMKKQAREYIKDGKAKDAHEDSLAHLVDAHDSYVHMVNTLPNWVSVSCMRPGLTKEELADYTIPLEQKVRSEAKIHEDVYEIVRKVLK